MNFKKASRNKNFDDFVNGVSADNNENKQVKMMISLPKEMLAKINEKTKRICTFAEYIKNTILEDSQYFTDEAIVEIYKKATWSNLAINDFIKFSLGFIDYAKPEVLDKNREVNASRLVTYTSNIREALKQRAKAQNLTLNNFIYIKLKVILETQNIFNEKELSSLIKQSNQANQTLINLISNKILKKDEKCA